MQNTVSDDYTLIADGISHFSEDTSLPTYVDLAEKALTIRFGDAKYIKTADEKTGIEEQGKEDDEII
jgi:hypothetical protein